VDTCYRHKQKQKRQVSKKSAGMRWQDHKLRLRLNTLSIWDNRTPPEKNLKLEINIGIY